MMTSIPSPVGIAILWSPEVKYTFSPRQQILSWLKTVSNTFQDLDFNVSLYNPGIKKLPSHCSLVLFS